MTDSVTFNRCIAFVSRGESLTAECVETLREAIDAYPWFMTARLLYASETGSDDSLAELHYSAYPRHSQSFAKISLEEFGFGGGARSDEDLIEKFLRKGEYRIVPDDAISEDDEAARSGRLDLSDDFVSEELAAIYLAQGLNRQAKDIYERLSLLNPEKSIYFAEIIGKIGNESPSAKKK